MPVTAAGSILYYSKGTNTNLEVIVQNYMVQLRTVIAVRVSTNEIREILGHKIIFSK